MLKIKDIYRASERVEKYVYKTPLVKDKYLSYMTGKRVYLKLENLQVTNAFKIRGSANVIPKLSKKQREYGLITASTGNHGLGFSYISGKLGIDSLVVVPVNAPKTKVENIRKNGSRVLFHGESYYEAAEYAHKLAQSENRKYICLDGLCRQHSECRRILC